MKVYSDTLTTDDLYAALPADVLLEWAGVPEFEDVPA